MNRVTTNEGTTSEQTRESVPDSADLTPAQQRALAVLLEGGTQDRAAQAAAVSTRTIRNWLADETFAAVLAAERRALWEVALCRVQQAAVQATDVLTQALSDAKATVRMRAAKLILDLQLKLQRLHTTAMSRVNQKPETRNQKLTLRNDAETIVTPNTPAAPPARATRLAMPQ